MGTGARPTPPPPDAEDAIAALLARLEALGAQVSRGQQTDVAQVAQLQERTGCRFPEDYQRFLLTHGAVAVDGVLRIYGFAPASPDLDVLVATASVQGEFAEWQQEPRPAVPFFGDHGFPAECRAFDADGRGHVFYRGELEKQPLTFEEAVLEELSTYAEELEEHQRRRQLQTRFLEAVAALVPAPLLVGLRATPDTPPALVLQRPADGIHVEVRFGDGREFGERSEDIFAVWAVPSLSPSEVNSHNQHTHFVRAAPRVGEGRTRFRGRLPTEGLDPATFLMALAADAGLPLSAPLPTAPTLDELSIRGIGAVLRVVGWCRRAEEGC